MCVCFHDFDNDDVDDDRACDVFGQVLDSMCVFTFVSVLSFRCLKLYCQCFQMGKTCNPDLCTCVDCVNLDGDSTGLRELAIQQTLEKRPDAFKKKPREKEPGSGCACKVRPSIVQ